MAGRQWVVTSPNTSLLKKSSSKAGFNIKTILGHSGFSQNAFERDHAKPR